MGTLNDQTIKKCETIKNAGYNHVSTYECLLAKTKISKKLLKFHPGSCRTTQSKGSLLWRMDKCNQTALQFQRT